MKKRKNLLASSPLQMGRADKIGCVPIQNPVAKFAHQFNKAHIFEDKNKYRRNAKHRKQEASPIALVRTIGEVSCVYAYLISKEPQPTPHDTAQCQTTAAHRKNRRRVFFAGYLNAV